jgi:hypothetical protein
MKEFKLTADEMQFPVALPGLSKVWSDEARAAALAARQAGGKKPDKKPGVGQSSQSDAHTRAIAANSAIEKIRNANNKYTLAASRASNGAELATQRNGVGSIQSRSNHQEAAALHSVAATQAGIRNDAHLQSLHMTAALAHQAAAKL